ncbi:MAG: MBOAT family O-acyltransferase, partial [Pseudomonadota bacterium]
MLFNTNVFIFVFLPVALTVFFIVRKRVGQDASFFALFALSLLFYAWWDIRFLPLLVGSILINLLMARRLADTRSRGLLIVGIVFNLGLLGVFKYLNLFDSTLENLFGLGFGLPAITLPIGISFYTFQQIAYLVDVYTRESVARPSLHKYGLFVSFFPQLIAGPIVHHKEMMSQFENPVDRDRLKQMVALGVIVFTIGLAKKVLIADPLGAVASPIFARADVGGDIHFFIAWVGTLAYTFQIYF